MTNERTETQTVLIRFRHGLGDAVQLTVVLQHLQCERPNWTVDVAALVGKHSAFRGLCRKVFVLDRDAIPPAGYDRIVDLEWPECGVCYGDSPSTKAECCLRDLFGIAPRTELCRYAIARSDAAMTEAARYLQRICKTPADARGRFPAVLIHYEGNTSSGSKNLPLEPVRALCDEVLRLGGVPVILDWDRRSPLPDDVRIFNPHADLELWGRTGTGDAEVLAALIEQSTLMIGVDSGPLHVAGATTTPTIAIWTGHHPLHYFCPAENVRHLLPERHAEFLRRNRRAGRAFFERHYRFDLYRDLRASLPAAFRDEFPGEEAGLVRSRGYWVRGDNVEQDLVIVRDIAEDDSYRIGELPQPRPVVVDVGAHIGCFAKRFHEHNPAARIIAVECCPENLPALRRNAESFATIVPAALTYERDVAILNAVYPNCVSTGGSSVLPRAELERRVAAQQKPGFSMRNDCPAFPEDPSAIDAAQKPGFFGDGYWADFRPLRTLTLEALMDQQGIDRIDVLKLDCEGSEFSILENTTSLDRIAVIVGEFHGRARFLDLVQRRFADWEFTILRDGDPGTFRLVNRGVKLAASLSEPRNLTAAPSRISASSQRSNVEPTRCAQIPGFSVLPPLLVAALKPGDPATYHLLRIEDGAVTATWDHPDGWLRGFARHDGRLWTIDSFGRIFRVDVGDTGITLELVDQSPLAREAHDLAVHDGRLWTAGSDEDAVVSYDPRTGRWDARRPWMPPDAQGPALSGGQHRVLKRSSVAGRCHGLAEGRTPRPRRSRDLRHVNSVLPEGDGFVLSYFSESPRPAGTPWRESQLDGGKVVRWGPRGFDPSPIATGVYGPHSLRRHGGRIWWCDSFRHRVCRDDGWRSPDLAGFTRGLRFHAGRCLVGLSRSRVAPYPEARLCGVCAFDPHHPDDRVAFELDESFIEVYDLIPLAA